MERCQRPFKQIFPSYRSCRCISVAKDLGLLADAHSMRSALFSMNWFTDFVKFRLVIASSK